MIMKGKASRPLTTGKAAMGRAEAIELALKSSDREVLDVVQQLNKQAEAHRVDRVPTETTHPLQHGIPHKENRQSSDLKQVIEAPLHQMANMMTGQATVTRDMLTQVSLAQQMTVEAIREGARDNREALRQQSEVMLQIIQQQQRDGQLSQQQMMMQMGQSLVQALQSPAATQAMAAQQPMMCPMIPQAPQMMAPITPPNNVGGDSELESDNRQWTTVHSGTAPLH